MPAVAIDAPTGPEGVEQAEPQTRGYFINLVRNLSPTWLRLEVERAAQAGFNLIVFPVYNNGWTLFPSQWARTYRMPPINPLFRKWDPLALVTEQARAAGLSVWAFARPYHIHPRFSVAEHRLLKKHPQWRMSAHPEHTGGRNRQIELRHPCPINEDYQRYVANILTEMIMGYPVDGVVMQFSGFGLHQGPLDQSPFCFCPPCRQRHWERFGEPLVDQAGGERLERVRRWQAELTQQHLAYLRHRLRRARRTVRLIGQMTPFWRCDPSEAERLRDHYMPVKWPEALSASLIDELGIEPAGEISASLFSNQLAADYAFLGDHVMWLPILRITAPDDFVTPLASMERYPVPGFIAEFQSSPTEAQALQIRERFFSRPALQPEPQPARTAAALLDRVRLTHEEHTVLHDLLSDLLRLLARQIPEPNDFTTLEMIAQNIHGLEQFIRRGRLASVQMTERTMRDLGLARRFVRMACMDVYR